MARKQAAARTSTITASHPIRLPTLDTPVAVRRDIVRDLDEQSVRVARRPPRVARIDNRWATRKDLLPRTPFRDKDPPRGLLKAYFPSETIRELSLFSQYRGVVRAKLAWYSQ